MTDSTPLQPFNQKRRQLIVKFLAAVAIALLFVCAPAWNSGSALRNALEFAGVLFILACMFGRLWSTLYVGTRKNSELVMVGPYSITRNPLYLFSTIGVFGIGLVFGSIVVALFLAAMSYLVFTITAKKEAAFLRTQFAPDYLAYETGTPQFWPDFRLYNTPSEITFSPQVLTRAFGDSLFFLAVIPVIKGAELLQAAGYLPILFRLP
jgi:protein-S-isoprenylcysteine O-methyltransferase Ste14